MLGRASDEEALRLTLAFYCILEPERRAEVLKLAERLAAQSEHVEGVTHFLDLTPSNEN
jgi:hypothetical protein